MDPCERMLPCFLYAPKLQLTFLTAVKDIVIRQGTLPVLWFLELYDKFEFIYGHLFKYWVMVMIVFLKDFMLYNGKQRHNI